MPVRRTIVAAAAIWLVALLAPPARAGQPAEQLFASIDRVLKLLDDPALKEHARAEERRQAIRRVAGEIFDFEEIARRSLARHWEARTPSERDEFVQLLRNLLERSFIGKLDSYNGEKVAVLSEAIDGDEATVKTQVVTQQGADVIPVDYRMVRRGDHWRACDIVIGGVSLVKNYRAQFDKIIQRTSYAQLVKQVREKQ
jgi:phospholipid transport system substrate-binding protein